MRGWQKKVEALFPPGYAYDIELKRLMYLWLLGILYSLRFFADYRKAYQNLFVWRQIPGALYAEYVLREGAKIPPFFELLSQGMLLFVPLILVLMAIIGVHYMYYRQGSKSIYLMRRLPDPYLLHRTCLVVPLLGVLLALITITVLAGIYYCVYIWVTPEICLP